MIPHEAFDLSILDDGEGVGSHFGYGTWLRRFVSGAQANITQHCDAFSGTPTRNMRGTPVNAVAIDIISGCCVHIYEAD